MRGLSLLQSRTINKSNSDCCHSSVWILSYLLKWKYRKRSFAILCDDPRWISPNEHCLVVLHNSMAPRVFNIEFLQEARSRLCHGKITHYISIVILLSWLERNRCELPP